MIRAGVFRSLALSYLIVPPPVFVVLGVTLMLLPDRGGGWILRQVLLLAACGASLGLFLHHHRKSPSSIPAAAVGATVGLLHWYPVYVILGSMVFREPAGGPDATLDTVWIWMFLVNLIVPVYTMISATYDGTLLTLPLCFLVFGAVSYAFWRRSEASSAGTAGS